MQKIYFNPKTNFTIVDVSGVKNPKKIAKEFNINMKDCKIISIDENTETYFIDKGKLSSKKKEQDLIPN